MAGWSEDPKPKKGSNVQTSLEELEVFERAASSPFLIPSFRVLREQLAVPHPAPKELIYK